MLETLKNGVNKFFKFLKPRSRLGGVSFIILSATAVFCLVVWVEPANAWGLVDATAKALAALFTNIVLFFAGLFMQLAIFFLKFILEIAVYNHYIDSAPVLLGWTLVRDIGNMFFVIILLIIAFATVLGLENYSWKKLLMKFVLAAILINFSRVICGVIIDAAQVFMTTFINGVAATAGGNLTQALNLNKMLSWSSTQDVEQITDYTVIGTAMAATFFAAVAAFTVGSYLAMLLIRAVVLWVLIILSPLAFVLNVIPKTQAYASKWWTMFGNEVIAGPILVFFLWLSFAVAGTGELHREFNDNSIYSLTSSIDQINADAEAVTNQKLSVGSLGEILEWENMASFIISVALLLVGVKVTKELSTVGGGVMGGIVDFGKKAAMVASGVAAARYLTRGAYEGVKKGAIGTAKFAAMKAPLGGEFWQRRGADVKGMFLTAKGELDIARNMKAGEWEATGADASKGGMRRLFGKLGSTLLETGSKKRKKAEAWTDAVKNLADIDDAYSSVSKSMGGAVKDETRVRAEQAKKFRETKGAQKGAEGMKKLLQTEFGREREDMIIKTALKGEAQKAELQGIQDTELAGRREKYMDPNWQPRTEQELGAMSEGERERAVIEDQDIAKERNTYQQTLARAAGYGAEKKIVDMVGEGRKVMRERDAMEAYTAQGTEGEKQVQKIPGLKAEGDYRVLQSDQGFARDLAAAKDAEWQKQGKAGGFLRAEIVKQNKEAQERLSVGSYDQARAQAQNVGNRLQRFKNIKNKQDKGIALDTDEMKDIAGIEDINGEIEKIERLAGNMAAANFNRGSMFGLDTMYDFFKKSGIQSHDVLAEADTSEKQKQNFLNTQANVVSYFSGKEIKNDADSIEEAVAGLPGGLREQMVSATADLANDAAVNYAGLFKEVLNEATGQVEVKALNWDSDQLSIIPKREYALSKSDLKKEGMEGSLDRIGGNTRAVSEASLRNLGNMVKSLTATTYSNMNNTTVNNIADAIINAYKVQDKGKADQEVNKLVESLVRAIPNDSGYEALMSGIRKSLDYKSRKDIELPKYNHKRYRIEAGLDEEEKKESKEKIAAKANNTANKRPLSAEEQQHAKVVFNDLNTAFASYMSQVGPQIAEVLEKSLKDVADKLAQSVTVEPKVVQSDILSNIKSQAAEADVQIDEQKIAEAIAGAIGKVIQEQARVQRRKQEAEEAKKKMDQNNPLI